MHFIFRKSSVWGYGATCRNRRFWQLSPDSCLDIYPYTSRALRGEVESWSRGSKVGHFWPSAPLFSPCTPGEKLISPFLPSRPALKSEKIAIFTISSIRGVGTPPRGGVPPPGGGPRPPRGGSEVQNGSGAIISSSGHFFQEIVKISTLGQKSTGRRHLFN